MNTRSQLLLVLPFLLARALAQDAPPTGGDDPFRKAAQTAAARPAAPSTLPPLKLVFETYTLDPMLARDVLVKDGPVKAYARARELAQAGQAKFAQSLAVVASSGHRVINEEIREIRYPVEWDPPKLDRPQEKPKSNPPKAKGKQPATTEAEPPPVPGINGIWIEDPTPTAFETRNVGLTIELGPSTRGTFCDASMHIQIVRHLGDREVSPGTKVVQPTFESRRISLNSIFPLGTPSLLGTLNGPSETAVPDEDTRLPATIAFVTATSDAQPAAEAAPAELPAGVFTAVVEVYSMPPEKALAATKEAGTAAIDRTLAFIAEGSARLEEIFALRGIATSSVRMAALQEFRYPIAWNQPVLSTAEAKRWPQFPAIFSLPFPNSMETREIGIDAEVGATPEPGGAWMAAAVVSSVRIVGQRETPPRSHIFHPTFETRKLSVEMRVPIGQPTLVGSFSAQAAEEEKVGGGFAPLTARIAEPKERGRAWLAFMTIHGAAVEPPAKAMVVVKPSEPANSGATPTTATPSLAVPPNAANVPGLPAASNQNPGPVATKPREPLISRHYDLSQAMLEKLIQNQITPTDWKEYLTSADVAFPPGSSASYSNGMLHVKNTIANLDRVETVLGVKSSARLFEKQLNLSGEGIDTQLLEEIPRPEALADPIPSKVWSCRKQFEGLGVEFPEGSYSVYLRNSKRLLIRNTLDNIDHQLAAYTDFVAKGRTEQTH